jgi:hypothetical protein
MINKIHVKELINLLIKLQNKFNEEDKIAIRKLFVGLVTPEWYYSDSYTIEFNSIDWKKLDNYDFIQNWIKKFNLERIVDYEDRFEKSFSSWYQPYHFFSESKWGTHIRSDAILRIAKKFYKYCPNIEKNLSESIKTGFLYVYFHHQYHNIIENSATLMEIKYNNPNIYQKYYLNFYSKALHSINCIEEILANEYMIRRMIEFNIDKEFLINGFQYLQEFQNFDNNNDETKYLLEEKLINQIYSDSIKSSKKDLDQVIKLINIKNNNYQNEIPIWLHNTPKPLH